jgi:hypothetical protein
MATASRSLSGSGPFRRSDLSPRTHHEDAVEETQENLRSVLLLRGWGSKGWPACHRVKPSTATGRLGTSPRIHMRVSVRNLRSPLRVALERIRNSLCGSGDGVARGKSRYYFNPGLCQSFPPRPCKMALAGSLSFATSHQPNARSFRRSGPKRPLDLGCGERDTDSPARSGQSRRGNE